MKTDQNRDKKRMPGFDHIIDDGHADGHGLILDKSGLNKPGVYSVPDGGCSVVDVPQDTLVDMLRRQGQQLALRRRQASYPAWFKAIMRLFQRNYGRA